MELQIHIVRLLPCVRREAFIVQTTAGNPGLGPLINPERARELGLPTDPIPQLTTLKPIEPS